MPSSLPAPLTPPPAPSHHLLIFIKTDSLLWNKPIPSELLFQLSLALQSFWIFFASRAACCHSSTVSRMWQRNLSAAGKPKCCLGMQNPDTVAFPSHRWWALCGALMLLYSSLREGFTVPIQQEMDLGNHRKQKRIPILRESKKILPWTLPRYLWQDRAIDLIFPTLCTSWRVLRTTSLAIEAGSHFCSGFQ